MQHSFKLIYVLVILFVIIVIVSMGMYIMSKTGEFTDKANLSLGENSEFNAMWQAYKGKQKGSNVKIIIQRIIDNAKKNGDEPVTLIDIAYKAHQADEFKVINSTSKINNIDDMQSAKGEIDANHFYTIDFVYSKKTKQIAGILIKYEEKEKFEFTPDEN